MPGRNPATTALRILLANAGVIAPHTGEPFSEAMLLGISGGIGAGVFDFRYEHEDLSASSSLDDICGRIFAYLNGSPGHLGVESKVAETVLPDDVPQIEDAKKLLRRQEELFRADPEGAADDLASCAHDGLAGAKAGIQNRRQRPSHLTTLHRTATESGRC